MTREEKLKQLVERVKQTDEFVWLSCIDLEKAKFVLRQNTKVVPTKNIIEIYSVRAKINEEKGNAIKGFNSLLIRLDKTSCENIIIHQMADSDGGEYRVFTDPDLSELIGVLGRPKK